MTHLTRRNLLLAGFVACLLTAAQPAAAQCFADYKAKQDAPLRLHYGVVQLRGACNKPSAEAEIKGRLSAAGWTLLNVLAVFGPDGLDQRKADAGPYYLRF
ncbi:hypothetical protein [Phaeobacter sp.]|uniref:hypothetical protein n=1 Tax=Phaeobacter sp. TaxID=1902409 RepID=UPI0025E442FA|nr:hypothetical protein [Phaeobacter sp.]